MTYSAFQSRSGIRGFSFTKSASQYIFQTRWLIFFVWQKQYEFYLKLFHFCTTRDPQANPASQENKESCNNFIRTMCFALEYFNINIKPPSPTPTQPLWILFCYILKLKNNISIHFSVSRYNLTHEMTSLNVILPRRQTLGLYTMDFLSSFMPVFQHQGLITLGKEPSGPDLSGCFGEHSASKWSP